MTPSPEAPLSPELTSDGLGALGGVWLWDRVVRVGISTSQWGCCPGRCQASAILTASPCPQGRPGEICVIGPKGQKVSCGHLIGRSGCGGTEAVVLSHLPYVCARETLALLGLRGWQESLGPQASLDPLE